MDEMDPVFKALADPHRRLLLDRLHERDGQTLTELQSYLPITRFGCMKHLRVLEEAGLVTSRKVGREKFHYLNPVPIQRAYDRWVAKYARPWTQMLSGLKWSMEGTRMSSKPEHVYEIYIQSPPERVWQALTDPDMTEHYYFGTRIESDFSPGSSYIYRQPDGAMLAEGTIVESTPPYRLVMTFRTSWTSQREDSPDSQVVWEIEPYDDQSKVRLIHTGIVLDTDLGPSFRDAWAKIASAMKTYLESQKVLVAAGS
jgi:uncharacterized protein YndB with AHSA1/START domain/DNA-binding transcriptional ArsR family regulator